MRRAAALLLSLAACLPVVDQAPPTPCALVDAGLAPAPEYLPVGRPADVELAFEAQACLPDVVFAEAEVRDVENHVVPVTVALRRAGRTAVATLAFTPQAAGPLSVTVRFEPTLAVRSLTLPVVAGPSTSGVASAISQPCLEEGVTARGAWLCLEAPGRASAWRGGALLQVLPALEVAVAGDDVWLRGPGRVERFVDRGGAFLLREPDVGLPLDDGGQLLPAGEGRLVVAAGAALSLLGLGAGGLELLGAAALPRGVCEGGEALTVDAAGTSWLACRSRPGFSRLCALDVMDVAQTDCREVPGEALGFEPGALWTRGGALLVRWTLGEARSLPLPTGWKVRPGRAVDGAAWPLVETAAGEVLLPTLRDAALGLEAPPPGVRVLGHGPRGVLVEAGARRSLLPRAP